MCFHGCKAPAVTLEAMQAWVGLEELQGNWILSTGTNRLFHTMQFSNHNDKHWEDHPNINKRSDTAKYCAHEHVSIFILCDSPLRVLSWGWVSKKAQIKCGSIINMNLTGRIAVIKRTPATRTAFPRAHEKIQSCGFASFITCKCDAFTNFWSLGRERASCTLD